MKAASVRTIVQLARRLFGPSTLEFDEKVLRIGEARRGQGCRCHVPFRYGPPLNSTLPSFSMNMRTPPASRRGTIRLTRYPSCARPTTLYPYVTVIGPSVATIFS